MDPEDDIAETSPLIHDGVDLAYIAVDQRGEFPGLRPQVAAEDNEEYQIIYGYCLVLNNIHSQLCDAVSQVYVMRLVL